MAQREKADAGENDEKVLSIRLVPNDGRKGGMPKTQREIDKMIGVARLGTKEMDVEEDQAMKVVP